MTPRRSRLLPLAACLALTAFGCEKTQSESGGQQNGSGQSSGQDGGQGGNRDASAEAGFDAVHDLVIRLIREREFAAALIAIDHLDGMRDEVARDKARQIDALRAALTAAQAPGRDGADGAEPG